jgi:hypothetical protein
VVKTKNNGRRTTDNGHVGKVGILVGGRIKYIDRPGAAAEKVAMKPARPKPQKAAKVKIDPKYLAAARELRDRYLERVNDNLALPAGGGKYNVSRTLADPTSISIPLLKAS